jgi:hypothetical protein
MILDLETCERLRALGPDALFHGTRYLTSILRDNELALPLLGTRAVFLATDPQVAAYWAQIPRPSDEARGAIIALDRTKLAAEFTLYPNSEGRDSNNEGLVAIRPILDLRDYTIEAFWLDELKPGCGLEPPPFNNGKPFRPVISFASVMREVRDIPRQGQKLSDDEFNTHYWEVIDRLETWAGMR